ncbi:FYVE zinc finger domain-containing protein [Francisella philomiragia]|uniref:FYVE zinc finger domain-containing protein n=1 Tax=Francisella philomiragia TaxID=28110 RepID=UPI003519BC3C
MKIWKQDQTSNNCHVCNEAFSFINRKHHCRSCGEIVCEDCSKFRLKNIPLINQIPRKYAYNPITDAVRICILCFKNPKVYFIDDTIKIKNNLLNKIFDRFIDIFNQAKLFQECCIISSSKEFYYKDYGHLNKNSKYKNIQDAIQRSYKHKLLRNHIIDDTGIRRLEKKIQYCIKISIANCYEFSECLYLINFYLNRSELNQLYAKVYRCKTHDHVLFILSSRYLPDKIETRRKDQLNSSIVIDLWKKSIFLLSDYVDYFGYEILTEIPIKTNGLPAFGSFSDLLHSV